MSAGEDAERQRVAGQQWSLASGRVIAARVAGRRAALLARYVVGLAPLAKASHDEIGAAVGPTLPESWTDAAQRSRSVASTASTICASCGKAICSSGLE
jgi:hypothetical protein